MLEIKVEGRLAQEFDRSGYVVIRDAISAENISILERDFVSRGVSTMRGKKVGATLGPTGARAIKSVLASLVTSISEHSSTSLDLAVSGVYWATYLGVNLGWHQDHLTYYKFQDSHNYCSFYIQIVKPEKEKSNLSIVPFHRLKELDAKLHANLLSSGAIRCESKEGGTVFVDTCVDAEIGRIPIDLDEIAETPHLSAGDLLAFRGDVLHRTQDADTDRLAVNVGYAWSKTVLTRELYLKHTPLIGRYKNPSIFAEVVRAFSDQGVQRVQLGDLYSELES